MCLYLKISEYEKMYIPYKIMNRKVANNSIHEVIFLKRIISKYKRHFLNIKIILI